MSGYIDVFFHQQSIPELTGTILQQQDTQVQIVDNISTVYESTTLKKMSPLQQTRVLENTMLSRQKKYIEIQLFERNVQLDSLLNLLKEMFPLFIATKIIEEIENEVTLYYYEFLPIAVERKQANIQFNLLSSLNQMGYVETSSISELIRKELTSIIEGSRATSLLEPSPVGIQYPIEITSNHSTERKKESAQCNSASNKKMDSSMSERDDSKKEIDTHKKTGKTRTNRPTSSEKADILYLKESLKRERAAKERVKIAKEKLEHELVDLEKNLLTNSLQRFKHYQTATINRKEWYKSIHIDLIQYDDLYRKAKFVGQSCRLNRQLIAIAKKLDRLENQKLYEHLKIEKLKCSVSELDLQSMMEQCRLIDDRIKIHQGFLFSKPKVIIFRVDYEQLERISAFFDIIQTENRLLESIVENEEIAITTK